MAIGDVRVVSQRPFSRADLGVLGDSMNLSARLTAVADQDEVVVSNTVYQQLDQVWQKHFGELDPVEARNIGSVKAWKLTGQESGRL